MQDYSHTLGDAVKIARTELGLTQEEVADKVDVDTRTIMNIENYKGNPKMETLFPLIRLLKRHGGKFCVSDFRQSQEYRMIHEHSGA